MQRLRRFRPPRLPALLSALTLGLAACGTAQREPQAPTVASAGVGARSSTATPTDQGCAVVLAGSVGSKLPDEAANLNWHQLNTSLAEALSQRLKAEGLPTQLLLVGPGQISQIDTLLLKAVNGQRCTRVLQVTHLVQQDKFGPFFRFDLQLSRVASDDRKPLKTIRPALRGEFEKSYRFARTPEALDAWRPGALADTAIQGMKAAGVWLWAPPK
ncbi:MAG: hypothetical protein RI907_258 [Pseudomonadota bacterium]|jgi:hypothetical protein